MNENLTIFGLEMHAGRSADNEKQHWISFGTMLFEITELFGLRARARVYYGTGDTSLTVDSIPEAVSWLETEARRIAREMLMMARGTMHTSTQLWAWHSEATGHVSALIRGYTLAQLVLLWLCSPQLLPVALSVGAVIAVLDVLQQLVRSVGFESAAKEAENPVHYRDNASVPGWALKLSTWLFFAKACVFVASMALPVI